MCHAAYPPLQQQQAARLQGVRAAWRSAPRAPLSAAERERLRRAVWDMFDHGYSNYLEHAFPHVRQQHCRSSTAGARRSGRACARRGRAQPAQHGATARHLTPLRWLLHWAALCAAPAAALQDNLLPVSCGGSDWQGGLALTLVDALDALLLLNRRADLADALERLRRVLHFDKDAKVRGSPGRWRADR